MCEFQEKLIVFLDRELPSEEFADVERHIEGCEECRNRLAGYELVHETFDAYCNAVATKARRQISHWVPVLVTGAAAAVVLFLALPQKRLEPPPVLTPTV